MKIIKTILTNILILIALGLILIDFFNIGVKNTADAELSATTNCPNTVNQALNSKCVCPDPIYYQVGCTNEIGGADKVKVVGATKIILDDKIYNVTDITNSSVKSTPVTTTK